MGSSNHQFSKSLQQFFSFFDLYGQSVTFSINKKPKYTSAISGIISLCVIVIIILCFIGVISPWVNHEKMTPFSASISYTASELILTNQKYEYEFNNQNYAIYWVLTANLPNGTFFMTKDLAKYFSYHVTLSSETDAYVAEMETESCKVDQKDIFLGLDEATVKNDAGKIEINKICIKNSFKLGIFPKELLSVVYIPRIMFSVYPCRNSTENDSSCASLEEINNMIQYTNIQTSIPTTLYDLKNPSQHQRNKYSYQYTQLDISLLKNYGNELTSSTLYVDNGLLKEEYQATQTNFIPNLKYEPETRSETGALFHFSTSVGLNFQMYYLRNQRLYEVAGILGGLIYLIFLIGRLLCVTYNSIYLKLKLISSTFASNSSSNSKKGEFEKNTRENSILDKMLSFCFSLFLSKDARRFYQIGAKNLHHYLDIRKIVKRMQDLDKFKMVLLTEEQRRLFECIPKPNFNDDKGKFGKSSSKNSKNQKITMMKTIADENDPINKRILEYIGSKNNNKPESAHYEENEQKNENSQNSPALINKDLNIEMT